MVDLVKQAIENNDLDIALSTVDISIKSLNNINNLLPGQFNTARIEALIEKRAKENGITSQKPRAKLEEENTSKRLGEISEFGVACAWICSTHSGCLVGQKILIGSFRSFH